MSIFVKSDELYNKGIKFFEKQDYKQAIDFFKKAVDLQPDNPAYLYNFGLACIKISLFDKAIECFKKTLKINPEDYDSNFNLALAYFEKQNFESAIEYFNSAVKINKKDYLVYDSLGSAYYAIKDYENALINFKQASELAPNDFSVLYNLAYTYFIKEDFEKACNYFLQVVSINPKDVEAFFNLAQSYKKLGKYKEAITAFKASLYLNPGYYKAKIEIVELKKLLQDILSASEKIEPEKQEKHSRGLDTSTKITKNSEELYNEAKKFLAENNFELAIEKLEQSILIDSNNLQAKYDLVNAQKILKAYKSLLIEASKSLANNDITKAISCYEKVLKINPYNDQAKSQLEFVKSARDNIKQEKHRKLFEAGETFLRGGNYDQAIDRFSCYIAQNPNDTKGHFNLGNAYRLNKEYINSMDSLKKAMLLDPSDKNIQNMFYEVTRLVNKSSKNEKDYIKVAKFYIEKNEHKKAFDALRMALYINPYDKNIKNMVGGLTDIIFKNKKATNSDHHEQVKNIEDEIKKYKTQLESNPADFKVLYKLAVIYNKQDSYYDALETLKLAIHLQPNDKDTQNLLFDVVRAKNKL